MTRQTFSILARHARAARFASALLSCLVVAIVGPAARAANTFTVNLSEKELKLKNPVDPAWESWLMGDIGYQRMIERNSPYVELVNTSTTPITEFRLTIGDNRFNFAPADGSNLVKLGRTTPGFSLTAHVCDPSSETCATDSGGDELKLGDELIVKIDNGGLQAGKLVRFKIKLGIDADFAAQYAKSFDSSVPDFRTVLFDMNGFNVYDNTTDKNSDDNAQASAVFSPGDNVVTQIFQDEDVAVSQYYNSNIRGGCCCAADPVDIFQPTPEVPEPGSFALAMIGMAGFSLISRSRGRRLAA